MSFIPDFSSSSSSSSSSSAFGLGAASRRQIVHAKRKGLQAAAGASSSSSASMFAVAVESVSSASAAAAGGKVRGEKTLPERSPKDRSTHPLTLMIIEAMQGENHNKMKHMPLRYGDEIDSALWNRTHDISSKVKLCEMDVELVALDLRRVDPNARDDRSIIIREHFPQRKAEAEERLLYANVHYASEFETLKAVRKVLAGFNNALENGGAAPERELNLREQEDLFYQAACAERLSRQALANLKLEHAAMSFHNLLVHVENDSKVPFEFHQHLLSLPNLKEDVEAFQRFSQIGGELLLKKPAAELVVELAKLEAMTSSLVNKIIQQMKATGAKPEEIDLFISGVIRRTTYQVIDFLDKVTLVPEAIYLKPFLPFPLLQLPRVISWQRKSLHLSEKRQIFFTKCLIFLPR